VSGLELPGRPGYAAFTDLTLQTGSANLGGDGHAGAPVGGDGNGGSRFLD